MKKAIVAAILAVTAISAFAQCPVYQPYRCVPGMNGKMICGCGM